MKIEARTFALTMTLVGALALTATANEPSLADEERTYLRLAAETIKKFEDAPAAEQERFISDEADRFMKKYPAGFIYLRASVQAWQANPEAYHAKWPDIFTKRNEPAEISVAPKQVTSATAFYDDLVSFEDDSEWKVLAALTVGKNLRSTNPLIGGLTTEGRYVIVVYSVKNLTGKPQMIFASPTLSDEGGSSYEALRDEAFYSEELAGAKTITIEQLPNGLTKKFAAIYELPEEETALFFNARELGKINKPSIKQVALARRFSGGNVSPDKGAGIVLRSLGKRTSIGGLQAGQPEFKPESDEVYVVARFTLPGDFAGTPDVTLRHPTGAVLKPDRLSSVLHATEYAARVGETGIVFVVPKDLATKNDWVMSIRDDPKSEIPLKLGILSANSDARNVNR